jgi:hypothetical protein
MKTDTIEKLKKILALANCKSATQGEIEAAMARAREIAARHGIEIATINFNEGKAAVSSVGSEYTKYEKHLQPYHLPLLSAIMAVFDVTILRHQFYRHNRRVFSGLTIVGEETDVAMAKEILPWLENMFSRSYARAIREGRFSKSWATANSYYAGLRDGIILANKRQDETLKGQDAQTWAMVVRSKQDLIAKKIEDMYGKLRNERSLKKGSEGTAYSYGREKGSNINLRQVEA